MAGYKIERDYVWEKRNFPFADMISGDSFFADVDARVLRSAARYFCKYRPGVVMKVKKEGSGARCYRVM